MDEKKGIYCDNIFFLEELSMTPPQQKFVLSIMTRDRVGIIHEVSHAISALGGNIADVRQSVLCGYFTMILLASFPAEITQRAIERKLAEVDAGSEIPIEAVVRPADERIAAAAQPENTYVLTAKGVDHIGIVATVSSFCVKHNINILDMSTTISGGDYIMILVIDLTAGSAIDLVRSDLRRFGQETGLNVVLQHHDIFRAVNEINLPIR